MQVLSSSSKTDRADFIDLMSFLPSNLLEEINPNKDALSVKTWSLLSAWKRWEDNDLGINDLI